MSSEQGNIIYIGNDKYTWIRLLIYLILIVIGTLISISATYTLFEWFLFIALITGVLIKILDDVYSKAGVEFMGDRFKIYSYPLFGSPYISETFPLIEYDNEYSYSSTFSSEFRLRDGTMIPANMNTGKARQLHSMLVERQVQIIFQCSTENNPVFGQ